MENDVMLGEMSGKGSRGRPITRWLDNANNNLQHEMGPTIV